MNKKQLLYSILTLFLLGLIVASGTYAYYSFTSDDKNISFNTSKELENYIIYNEGESKFVGDFKVSSTYTEGMHSTISLYKTSEAANVDLIATIKMDINEIGTNIKNSSALKWVVTSGTSTNVGSVLAQGNFIGVNNNDTLTLVPNIEVTTSETFYTIWIWLDENSNPSDELTGETLDVNVWTEINQVEGIEDSFEITRINANYQEINATIVNNKNMITSYAITTSNTEPNEWTSIDATNQSNVYNLNHIVSQTGTYYVWIKDSEGNTISRSIEVTSVDTTAPTCTWGTFNPTVVKNNVTSQIELTCTDSESNISYGNLKTSDITVSNNNITVTNIRKTSITNGYKYIITVTGSNTDGTSTLTLPSNKVKNGTNLGNSQTTSSASITVQNVVTYTINYYQGNGTSTAGTTKLGESTCNYGESCTLNLYTSLGGTFPGSSNGWSFNGWSDTETGTTVTYTNGQTFTYNTEGNINLYAIGRRTFKFSSGIAPTANSGNIYQYWNPYSTASSYVTSISVPTATSISSWTFIGYRATNTASSTTTIASSYAGTTYKPSPIDLTSFEFRSIYQRTLTVSYNANSGSGTTNPTTLIQYYNSGFGNGSANSGANITSNSITLATNSFTKTGYEFSKWAEGSASGNQYNISSTYTGIGASVSDTTVSKTMYAIWIDTTAPTGTISSSYNSNTITATVDVIDLGSGEKKSYGWKVSTSSVCNSSTTGFTDTTVNTYNFNITNTGMHYLCVRIEDNAGNKNYISTYASSSYIDYSYTGNYQTFTVPTSGYYKLESWGAQGGYVNSSYVGGLGAYTSGYIYLNQNETIYIYVGGTTTTLSGGYNGGGTSIDNYSESRGGGGATDFRYFGSSTPSSSDLVWNSTLGLNSRIMVAAGGGSAAYPQSGNVAYRSTGGNGGGLIGNKPSSMGTSAAVNYGTGSLQQKGGYSYATPSTTSGIGTFGCGGNGTNSDGGAGGGGGYFGGGGSHNCSGAGGGSSFISGYAGVNAITSSTSRTLTNNTRHYSGKYFLNGTMAEGNNSGNGKAKITYVGETLNRTNTNLDGVRYIKDCIGNSNINSNKNWVEFQAIKNGLNLAKGKTGTFSSTANGSISYLTDGMMDNIKDSNNSDTGFVYVATSGDACVTIDLGSTYNLDEVAVWHWYDDNRIYNSPTTQVSTDNSTWTTVINSNGQEIYDGRRVSAYEEINISGGDGGNEPIEENLLYNKIALAAVSDGISSTYVSNSSGINFKGISSDYNGKGVYIRANTINDDFPIYYYRGNVNDNNVLFGGFCWKIVRTTSTGGTKLIYNGTPVNGQCTNTTGTETQLAETKAFNSSYNSPADVGYMYGTRYTYTSMSSTNRSTSYKYGNGVSWNGSSYTLTNTIDSTGTWATDYNTLNNNHYTCLNTTGTCTSVYYVFYTSTSEAYYITLTNGKTVENAIDEMLTSSSNTTDSTIKAYLDSWYTANLTSYANYLEDTVWCNDRSISALNGWEPNGGDTTKYLYFGAYERRQSGSPIVACPSVNDSFTTSNSNGNGKLTNPIGLLTMDEVNMAGATYSSNSSYYLYTNQYYWLGSPYYFVNYIANEFAVSSNGNLFDGSVYGSNGVRPAVSLKHTVKYNGQGTSNNPYTIILD